MASRAPRPSWTNLPPLDNPPSTVLDWLVHRFSKVSRATWGRRMEEGLVRDSQGQKIGVDAPYIPHLRLSYFREVESEPLPKAAIRILHLDEYLVVADKPPFLPVTPGGRFVQGCLLYLLEEQLGIQGLAPAHRLDRATSGLVLLTRKKEVRSAYTSLFAKRQVERVYTAVAKVPVLPEERRWKMESRIVSGTPFFRMQEVEGEANAWTTIELEHWERGWGCFTLRPDSGKTHQLRLHMARLGWPIFGDRLYPELMPERPDDFSNPLRLVARRLVFRDPLTGEERMFESCQEPVFPGGQESCSGPRKK